MDLYEACENGNEERIVELLIAFDAASSRTSSAMAAARLTRKRGTAGRTTLHAACLGGQVGAVRLLLGEPYPVYFTSRTLEQTEELLLPLVHAYHASGGGTRQDEGDQLFRVSMQTKDDGREPVPMAVVQFHGAPVISRVELLEAVTHIDDFGNTPLQCVSCFGVGTTQRHIDDGLEITRQLLRHGDQPNVPKIANQWTPLHWSAYNGNHEQAALLLDPVHALIPAGGDAQLALGRTQASIPLLTTEGGLFAVDVAGRRGLALAEEMQTLRQHAKVASSAYGQWRLRLDHVRVLQLFTRAFLESAGQLTAFVAEMNARLPSLASRAHRNANRVHKPFTKADAFRYGQHLLYWMGCFGLVEEVRALLDLKMDPSGSNSGSQNGSHNGSQRHAENKIVRLNPLYVCSCEKNKRQSVLHAVAVHGQHEIVRLLLAAILAEQSNISNRPRATPIIHRPKVSHIVPVSQEEAQPLKPTVDLHHAVVDVASLVDAGWVNYRRESPLFLAVLHLQHVVVETFYESLSPKSLAWEIKNCNIEGSYLHHVADDRLRALLGLAPGAITATGYVLTFDGLTQRLFKETIIETLREDSVVAPSLEVTRAGEVVTPSSWWGLRPARQADYIVVNATEEVLMRHAQVLQLKVKHRGSAVRSKYNSAEARKFESFRSLQRQQVVQDIIQKNLNVAYHVEQSHIAAIFPLHDVSGCKSIIRQWVRTIDDDGRPRRIFQPFNGTTLNQFLREKRTHQYEQLWPLLTYFGEKHAFYYAFMMFYTVWLSVIAVPGLLCQLLWSVGGVHAVSPLISVVVALWATIVVERWKRKKSEIQCNFGNFTRNRNEEAPGFYGDFQVAELHSSAIDIKFPKRMQRLRIYIGIPILFTMASLVVVIFVGVKLASEYSNLVTRVAPWLPHAVVPYAIPICNAVSMIVLDNVYAKVALALTQWENHRTVWQYESMLAIKLFWFKFLNAFISLFWVAFVQQNASLLRTQLIVIMGFRQVWYTFIQNIVPLLVVNARWNAAGFCFQQDTSGAKRRVTHEWFDAELPFGPQPRDAVTRTVPSVVLVQEYMYAPDFLMQKQMEIVLQFGYITMFVSVLPIAPLLALVSNMVNTRLDVICSTQVKKRPDFQSETEVSTFTSILEFMSFAAVAVNCAVLFFTTKEDFQSLFQAVAAWRASSGNDLIDELSLTIKKLWILLVVEHVVLGVKAMLSLTIDDTASWVQKTQESEDDKEKQRAPSVAVDPGAKIVAASRVSSMTNLQSPKSEAAKALEMQIASLQRERDEGIAREQALRDQLQGYSMRLLMLEGQGDNSVAPAHLTIDRADSLLTLPPGVHSSSTQDLHPASNGHSSSSPDLHQPTLLPSIPMKNDAQRHCVVCLSLRNRKVCSTKRCLSCRYFFCDHCDEILHLDDLGVKSLVHMRVRVSSASSSTINNVANKGDGQIGGSTNVTVRPQISTIELKELMTLIEKCFGSGDAMINSANSAPDIVKEGLAERCAGCTDVVVRYVRNLDRHNQVVQHTAVTSTVTSN